MFDFIVSPGATLNVRVINITRPDQALRDQMNRIETGLATLTQGVARMENAQDAIKREVIETRSTVAVLTTKIGENTTTIAQLAEVIRQNAGDNQALVDAAANLDTLQSETDAFLRGLVLPATSFVDQVSFDVAAAAYKGPKGITLDAAEVKAPAAGAGSLDYFTHSADGHIDMTGPTD